MERIAYDGDSDKTGRAGAAVRRIEIDPTGVGKKIAPKRGSPRAR